MGFNVEKFERAKFAHRTRRVKVDPLVDFFDEGEPAEWEVRGLSANEFHRAAEAANRQDSMVAMVRAMTTHAEKVAAYRESLGLGENTPGELAKRMEMLVMGSVAPKIELPIAVKLAENFPVEFLMLTQAITELSGQGADLVKPDAASHATPA